MSNKEAGYNIIELLMTVVVLAIFAASITTIFLSIQRIQYASYYREIATRAAYKQIEELRNSNYPSLTPGSTINFTSSLPDNLPDTNSGTAAISEPVAGLRRVDVTVTYPHQGTTQTVKLSSLIGEIGITQ